MQPAFRRVQREDRQGVQAPCFVDLKTFKTEVKDGQVYVDMNTPPPPPPFFFLWASAPPNKPP